MMKKIDFKIITTLNILMVLTSVVFLISPYVVMAQSQPQPFDYTVLAPLPGTTDTANCTGPNCKASLTKYIPGLFNLIIGLSAVIAVAYIIFGGFQYITTDAIAGKSEGREHIKNAIFGLFMICIAWLILYTINPRLLTFNLNISNISVPTGGPTGTLTPSGGVVQFVANSCPQCSPVRNDLTYQLSQSYLNSLSCTTCVPLSSSVYLGGSTNNNVLPDTNTKLTSFSQGLPNNIAWYVSEAYPPVVQHANVCHRDGSCVDANFGVSTIPNATNVNTFVNTASSNGLRAIYEVQTATERQNLINSGVKSTDIMVVSTINRNHFSVYNCGASPQSCANLP